jgi:hypothetical protein
MAVAALLTSCSSPPSAPPSSKATKLEDFKEALIAYIDAHPGYFIGRAKSEELREKPLVVGIVPNIGI